MRTPDPRAVPSSIKLVYAFAGVLVWLMAERACAQVPSVLWSTNIGARVFAVDAQTNVYAHIGGTVIKLDGSGIPLETNAICPLPGLALRDPAGNFYFTGAMPSSFTGFGEVFGAQDFGGITVSNKACFIAKYTPGGVLVWAQSFGPEWVRDFVRATDLQITESGVAYATYNHNQSTSETSLGLARFASDGSKSWDVGMAGGMNASGSSSIGGVTESNGYWHTAVHTAVPSTVYLYRFDTVGARTKLSQWSHFDTASQDEARPIGNSAREIYNVEGEHLTKRNEAGSIVWQRYVGSSPRWWTIGKDLWDGVYLATWSGGLVRYDSDGTGVWGLALNNRCVAFVSDTNGNRFLGLANGAVVRLGAEALYAPEITNPPQSLTVLAGDHANLSVGATGSTLRYIWLRSDIPVSGETNATLQFQGATPANAGVYSVIVSNFINSVTSSPVQLRVKFVQTYLGSQMLTNGSYSFATNPVLTVRSVYPSGSIFYTLDGTQPTFGSTSYTGPIHISSDAIVRAIGYSADWSQSDEADPVEVLLVGQHLSASWTGGGSISLSPPGGTYLPGQNVIATATPVTGWRFLYWLGDAAGTNASVSITMNADRFIQAVFGTTLATTVTGGGSIDLWPPGGVYPYGTTVRLTGVPNPGNYFGFWGNAATGNTNPLYFTITSPNATVSSIFAATPGGQAALTVLIEGRSQVSVSPRANVYSTGQVVALTAVPDSGQSFLNWSGDAVGGENPLNLSMSVPRVVTAHFTGSGPLLRVDRAGLEGVTPEGFRLTVQSDPQSVFQILASTVAGWETLATLTNTLGEAQFTDTNSGSFQMRLYRTAQ